MVRTLRQLVAGGELVRVYRGLYYKGTKTVLGMTRPRPIDLALRIGGPGSGPCEYTAAHILHLTTQVPAQVCVAVPKGHGRIPTPPEGSSSPSATPYEPSSSSHLPKSPFWRSPPIGRRRSRTPGRITSQSCVTWPTWARCASTCSSATSSPTPAGLGGRRGSSCVEISGAERRYTFSGSIEVTIGRCVEGLNSSLGQGFLSPGRTPAGVERRQS